MSPRREAIPSIQEITLSNFTLNSLSFAFTYNSDMFEYYMFCFAYYAVSDRSTESLSHVVNWLEFYSSQLIQQQQQS